MSELLTDLTTGASGALVGAILGLVGGGGSILAVPLLVYAPSWYKPGSVETPVDMASMAPTLARLLGVARPPAAAAAVLPLQAP